MKNQLKTYTLFLCLLLGLCYQAIAQAKPEFLPVSSGVQYALIGTYDTNKLDHILNQGLEAFLASSTMSYADFKGSFPPARYPVKLFRIKYHSVIPELDNRPTIASGLIAIPDTGQATMPIVSYQHGTVFSKNQVPSNPDDSMETQIMIARFASQGYIVIGADYFGKGLSTEPDSYLVKGGTQQACLDMLFASNAFLAAKNIQPGPLFISGWSQGGWATMVFLNKLEALDIPVTAAATASAPVDVLATMNRWLNNYQPIDAVYLPGVVALQIQAQEFYHRQIGLTASAIRPQYLEASRNLYNNVIDWETFRKLTQDKLQDFINPEFLASGNLGESHFWRTLENNQAYRWRSHTPLINYYGERDEVTPIYIAKLPEGFNKVMGGGPTLAKSAGKQADHRATFIFSVIDQKKWFDTFLRETKQKTGGVKNSL